VSGRPIAGYACAIGLAATAAASLAAQAGGQAPAATQPAARGGQVPPARGAAPPAAANTRRFVLVGCVSREGTAPNQRFLITDSRGDKPIVYRLEGDVNELSFHVGHTIETAGPLTTAAAAATGPNATALTMKVESITYVSNTCAKK
jgi:hypothetical protein